MSSCKSLFGCCACWGYLISFKVKSETAPTITTTTTATMKQKREKKVYSLPGQKYDPPAEILFCCRRMMEHGLLSPDRARKAYEKKKRKQKQLHIGTPIKSPETPSEHVSSRKQPPNNGDIPVHDKFIADSDDAELILSPKRKKR